jgi:hypothetical protein
MYRIRKSNKFDENSKTREKCESRAHSDFDPDNIHLGNNVRIWLRMFLFW